MSRRRTEPEVLEPLPQPPLVETAPQLDPEEEIKKQKQEFVSILNQLGIPPYIYGAVLENPAHARMGMCLVHFIQTMHRKMIDRQTTIAAWLAEIKEKTKVSPVNNAIDWVEVLRDPFTPAPTTRRAPVNEITINSTTRITAKVKVKCEVMLTLSQHLPLNLTINRENLSEESIVRSFMDGLAMDSPNGPHVAEWQIALSRAQFRSIESASLQGTEVSDFRGLLRDNINLRMGERLREMNPVPLMELLRRPIPIAFRNPLTNIDTFQLTETGVWAEPTPVPVDPEPDQDEDNEDEEFVDEEENETN